MSKDQDRSSVPEEEISQEKSSLGRKFVRGLEFHIVNSTALLVATHPMFTLSEVTAGYTVGPVVELALRPFFPDLDIPSLSDEQSIAVRKMATYATYGGLSFLYIGGSNLSRKLNKISESSRERAHTIHDISYGIGFNLFFSPLLYWGAMKLQGLEPTLETVMAGTAVATVLGCVAGWPARYAADVCKDLAGLGECKRPSYPDLIKRQSPTRKKGIFGLSVAASVGLMSAIYGINPNDSNRDSTQDMGAPNQLHVIYEDTNNQHPHELDLVIDDENEGMEHNG